MGQSKSQVHVESWRKRTKHKMVSGFGGICNKCGYNDCIDALDFHHLDSNTKEFGISNVLKSPKSWEKIVIELKKCILLCCRCHRELHCNIWSIEDIKLNLFSEDKCDDLIKLTTGECVICHKDVYWGRKTCSRNCAARLARNINWPDDDQIYFLLESNTQAEVARILDVSLSGFKKHLKRIRNPQ